MLAHQTERVTTVKDIDGRMPSKLGSSWIDFLDQAYSGRRAIIRPRYGALYSALRGCCGTQGRTGSPIIPSGAADFEAISRSGARRFGGWTCSRALMCLAFCH